MSGSTATTPFGVTRPFAPVHSRSRPCASRKVHGWYLKMRSGGSVKLSSFTSPLMPNPPWSLPTKSKRPARRSFCGASLSLMRAASLARPRNSRGRRGLDGLLGEVGDLVAHLRTLADPEIQAFGVEFDRLLGARR